MLKKGRMLYASLARQVNVQKVILGVDGTAAGFFAYFFDLLQKSMKNKHHI